MQHPAYELKMPSRRTTGTIFASPHSGREYPWAFLRRSVLGEHAIRSSEDAFVDQLFDSAPKYGAPFLRAGAPRCFVDLNRGPDELDPALIEGVVRQGHNPRIASGLGVIPRVVSGGRAIYDGKLTRDEAQRRIDLYWRPYHQMLERQLNEAHALFGEAILIDCHSMPHEAIESLCRHRREKPEIVIGDRYGAAAGAEIVERIEAVFLAEGFKVARNTPFAGAYTAQTYGRPSHGSHVVQIEIDRALYMNETELRPNGNFATMRQILARVIAEMAEIGRPDTAGLPLAAE